MSGRYVLRRRRDGYYIVRRTRSGEVVAARLATLAQARRFVLEHAAGVRRGTSAS